VDKRLTENFHAVIQPHQILRLEAGLGRGLGLEEHGTGLGLEERGTGLAHGLEERGTGLAYGLKKRGGRLEGLEERGAGFGLQERRAGLGVEERGTGLAHGLEECSAGLEGLEEHGVRLGLGLVNAKITELFSEAYNWDPFPMKVLAMLEKKVRYCKDITLAECSRSPTGRLLY